MLPAKLRKPQNILAQTESWPKDPILGPMIIIILLIIN